MERQPLTWERASKPKSSSKTIIFFIILNLIGTGVIISILLYLPLEPFKFPEQSQVNTSQQQSQGNEELERILGIPLTEESKNTTIKTTSPQRTSPPIQQPPQQITPNQVTDEDYLFPVEAQISEDKKSFSISYNNKELRSAQSNEKLYMDKSNGALAISYEIKEKTGGVDIIYTIQNPTSQEQNLPEFQVQKIAQDYPDYIYPYGSAGFKNTNTNQVNYIAQTYPDNAYSPIILSKDEEFTAGSSLQYPYLSYKDYTNLRLIKQSDSWTHNYRPTTKIKAGETRTYTLSIRFASPRDYIFTLEPYKKYFNSLYGNPQGTIQNRDTRAIRKYPLSFNNLVTQENPKGYRLETHNRIDLNGWQPFVESLTTSTKNLGYQRLMLRRPSGTYGTNTHLNFPPQFMSELPQKAKDSTSALQQFELEGISLGYWWGRSAQIPIPNQWPPDSLEPADLSNSQHTSFLKNEISLAAQYHAREIGLDAFTYLSPEDRYEWIPLLKSLAPEVKFIHEREGPDFLHRQISNIGMHTETKFIKGPDMLAWYLNPSSEIIITQFENDQSDVIARTKELMSWGFTPQLEPDIDISAIQQPYELLKCLNGIDDDNDGLIDIYDLGCESEKDNSE